MKTRQQKTIYHPLCASVLVTLFLFTSFVQLNAQTIPPTNTGTACANCAPPGWQVYVGSIDISNTVGWAGNAIYPWAGVAVNPPNGHTTWVEGIWTEVSGTNITGLVPGLTYDFQFYTAELQSTAGGTIDVNYDGVLEIFDCNTNQTLATYPYTGGANNAWTLETLTFTATSSIQSVCFKYQTGVINGNFWNVSFGGTVVIPSCDLSTNTTFTNVSCNGAATGAASAAGINGSPPYTYLWSNGSNAQIINGLTAGTYIVTISDADGCSETDQVTLTEPPALTLSVSSSTVPCSGGTGSATATANGGVPGYAYYWSNGQIFPTATGLAAGTYTVTVIDANQCTTSGSVTVTAGAPVTLNVSSTNVTCFGEKDGTATATIGGGTPPFQYNWSNGQNQITANTLDAGIYTVTVIDAAGCSDTETVFITEPGRTSIVFEVEHVGCDSVDDGTTTAISIGGINPVTYQWDNNAGNQTTNTAVDLGVGVYQVTLTDANGCASIGGITVANSDCAPPCEINPCVEAVINNTNICTAIANDPSDPLATLDCDSDGVTNADECTDSTDPLDPCDYEDTSITLPVTADQSECPMPCADLTPIMTILPGNIAGQSPVEVAIQITELNSVDTDGSVVVVRVPSDPRFIFVWNIGLTMAALVPVQNSDWNYLGDNGIVHTWTYNGPGLVIPAGGSSALGFQSFYDPQSTNGQTTLTATIIPFSGGECNLLNNTDSERLVYFE